MRAPIQVPLQLPLSMNSGKLQISFITVFAFLLLPVTAKSQFLNIEIDVEPEVETLIDRSLDFGQIMVGSGYREIPLGSPSMGVFQIRALRAQRLIISLETDEALTHSDPDVNESIMIDINASYTNNGVDDYRTSTPLSSLMEGIILEGPPQNPEATWSSIFIYIYGGIEIGNVPVGTYLGEVTLTVIYE
jgi:hypothetical protein